MKIRIKPADMLFFRDSKPFERGEDHWAESMFFPNLTTIYGALRTACIAGRPKDFDKLNTDEDPTRGLRIKKTGYLYKNRLYYTAPADLVVEKEELDRSEDALSEGEAYTAILLSCQKIENQWNSLYSEEQIEYVFTAPEGKQVAGLSIPVLDAETGFEDYVSTKQENHLVDLKQCIGLEDRMGIARNDRKRTAEEGLIYRISQVRYSDLELMVEMEWENGEELLPDEGFLKVGGQGNASYYCKYSEPERPPEEPADKKVKYMKYMKLYLPVPAIFKNGWIPDFITDTEKKTGQLSLGDKEYKVKLISACIPGSVNIGGFDMKKKREKPFRRAVMAGSVYLLELEDSCVMPGAVKEIWLQSEQQKEGYGLAYMIGMEKL
ncbi:MAG: type III-B CRISPR module-associated protein Cmr3 [Lachnospiraceae bacterium]|nr:type III-B CRISPR module-associated protein Cmr3 [Lachnospiraceae bacterium]